MSTYYSGFKVLSPPIYFVTVDKLKYGNCYLMLFHLYPMCMAHNQ